MKRYTWLDTNTYKTDHGKKRLNTFRCRSSVDIEYKHNLILEASVHFDYHYMGANPEHHYHNVRKNSIWQIVGMCGSKFLDLPTCLVRRILFFVFIDGVDENGSLCFKPNNLLNLLYTCKDLYNGFIHMVYVLKPLSVYEISAGTFWRRGPSAQFRLMEGQLALLSRESICSHVSIINIRFNGKTKGLTEFLEKMPSSDGNRGRQFSSLAMFYRLSFFRFRNLRILSVHGKSLKVLTTFFHIPESIRSISVFLDYKERTFGSLRELSDFIRFTEEKDIHAKIEHIQFIWKRPALLIKKHSGTFILGENELTHWKTVLSRSMALKLFDFDSQNKKPKMLGHLLYVIIKKFRLSLRSLQLENLDAAFLFSLSKLEGSSTPNEESLHFPRMQLMLCDSSSRLNLNLWLPVFQNSNLCLRYNRPLFIVLHNTFANCLMTTTAHLGDQTTQFRCEEINWSTINEPYEAIREIKNELAIEI